MKYYTPIAYILTCLVSLVFFVLSTYGAMSPTYSMRDLEILSEEKNFIEFFDHAMDIRPLNRNTHWQDLVYKGAENYLNEIIETQQYGKETIKYVEKLAFWPTLRNNEIFQVKRAQYGLKYFTICLDNARKGTSDEIKQCQEEMHTFWKNTPKDFINLQLGIDLAALVKQFLPSSDVGFYYSTILLNKYAGSTCDKIELVDFFLKQIESENVCENSPNSCDKIVDQFASSSCFEYMVPHLKQKILDSQNPKLKGLYLSMLHAKKYLTPLEIDFFFTSYVLDGPSNGQLFNLAWNIINELGKNHKRREAVLDKFKQLPWLPGELFKTSDHERLKIIMSLLSKNIPEYLDYYAMTCIRYLRGESHSISGNPTPGCHELFKKSDKENWLPPHFKQTYKQSL